MTAGSIHCELFCIAPIAVIQPCRQNHLTVGERERNFDSRGNFSQKPRSTVSYMTNSNTVDK